MRTFYIEQFGCRATQADGAALERQLRERGFISADESADADVVVVNTCTVTAAADSQARNAIRKLHARNPSARVIVTGCYAQRAPEELVTLPGVSWVVGNSHKPEIPHIVGSLSQEVPSYSEGFVPAASLGTGAMSLQRGPAKILTGDIFEQTSLLAAPVLGGEGNHTRPVLKIQDGCNSRCSYCVIPFGILDETKVERLRISSIEPLDVTRDLIALFASTDRIAQHFHLPLQSGSDRILAAMHRWYRAEHYARRVELIREHLPNAAIGADVIAGFPGETDADHSSTVAFIERLPFTYLHAFSFSKRPGTRAAALQHEVPAAVIKQRAHELRALGEAKSAVFRRSQIGRTLRVLTLHPVEAPASQASPALSSNYLRARVRGAWPANLWLHVRVEDCAGPYLLGQVEEPQVSAFAPQLREI